MKLQGRELKPRMSGEDVKLLHAELQQLGYTLPEAEVSQQFYGDATEAAVRQFQKKHDLPVTGSVDHQTAAAINQAIADQEQFIVQGRVMHSDGVPVTDATVRAFDKGLCEEKLLGEVKVSSGFPPPTHLPTTFAFPGTYRIIYTRNNLVQPDKGAANLVVRAYRGRKQIAESAVIFNAKKEETVDLIVGNEEYRGPSDFTQVKPVVERVCEDKSIKDLTEEEIQFVASDTGLEVQKIATLAQAEKLAAETKFSQPEIFYALGRQNLPIHSRTAILAQSPSVLRTSLESAVRENLISQRQLETAGGIDGVLAKFRDLIVDHAFMPPEVEGKYNLSQLLTVTTKLKKSLQRRFLTMYVNHEGTLPEFWKKVEQDPELKAHVPKLQFGLQLGTLTGNHVPLVQHLQKKVKLQSLRDAARFTRDDWLSMIETTGAPPDIPGDSEDEKKQNYAQQLTRTVEAAFPTAVIADRLQRDEEAPFIGPRKGNLLEFFASHTDFELSKHIVDDYIAERDLQVEPSLRQDLKAMQRLYKLVPQSERWSSMQPLLKAKLDSAHKIALMSRPQFLRRFATELGGEDAAAEVYNNARQVAATALHLYAMFSAEYNNIQLPVIRDPRVLPDGNGRPATIQPTSGALPAPGGVTVTESGGTVTATAAITAADAVAPLELPDWVSLFGPFHLCECEHCRSVYSPAAYLVDILHFLEGVPMRNSGFSALWRLRERRSNVPRREDILDIELSCQNTNTVLPYIDLVNEILEEAIAPRAKFTPYVSDFLDFMRLRNELDNGIITENIQQAFAAANVILSDQAVIETQTPGSKWIIRDRGETFYLNGLDGRLDLQTRKPAEELAVAPEHLNLAAYLKLKDEAIYPFSLPFDLPLEQARIFLDHLGVPRWRLMEAFHKADGSEPTDPDIAGEYLGLSTTERQIVTGTLSPKPEDWEFWGLDSGWLNTLRKVPEFLNRSGLTFAELEQLLNTRFINPARFADKTTGIDVKFPGTDCDLSGAEFKLRQGEDRTGQNLWGNLNDSEFRTALNKMHRFIRLWRKLSWSMQELDMALAALHNGTPDTWEIDEAFIQKLAVIQRLHKEWKRPVVELLSWWANLETTDYNYDSLPAQKSFYEQLFLNEALVKPLDPAFELDDNRTELKNTSEQISDHVPALVAVLRISEEELLQLADVLPDQNLNLANLSTLYRHVSLARTLRLSVSDFLTAKTLVGDPFADSDPAKVLAFRTHLESIRRSGFDIDELTYLLQHQANPESNLPPTEDEIRRFLEELRDGLQKIHQQFLPLDQDIENYVFQDPYGVETMEKLATVLANDSDVQIAMAIIAGTAGLDADQQDQFIKDHGLLETVRVVDQLDENDQKGEIDQLFANILDDTSLLKQRLVDSSPTNTEYRDPQTKLNERFEYVLELVTKYLYRTAIEQFAVQKLASQFQLDIAIADRLGNQWLNSVGSSNPPALDDFIDWNVYKTTHELTQANAQQQHRAYIRWHKSARVISGFRLSEDELEVLFSHASSAGWLDLNDLPLDSGSAPVAFEKWLKLAVLFAFRDRLRPGETPFARMLEKTILLSGMSDDEKNTAKKEFLEALSDRTGWSMENLETLVGIRNDHSDTGLLGLAIPATNNVEQIFSRLQACFDLIHRTGAAAERFEQWRRADLTFDDAAAIRQAVKAKYDEKQWLKIARPLQDVLREKQRDALVAWLIGNDDRFENTNDLHAYFLIDTQMSACQMTSRIKQAISSVQLFVQRCLMNLEPEVKIDPEQARQWVESMKNYRVWEANRKVFLYPENWIEPELRDDKSPFFIDLENELLQNEITAETVEQAYRTYLEKLDQVARLEIMGMYEDREQDVLHVFGRTFNTPHIYFYRRRVNDSYWTPWERVDLDIEGDHLIPVVWNGRLYLFWPIFSEKQEEKTAKVSASGSDLAPAATYWEIKLAWSEYKNGKWVGKKVSTNNFTSTIEEPKLSTPKNFVFKGWINKHDLMVDSLVLDANSLILTGLKHTGGSFSFNFRPILHFSLTGCNDRPNLTSENWFAAHFPNDPLSTGANKIILPEYSDVEAMAFVEKPKNEHMLILKRGTVDSFGHFIADENTSGLDVEVLGTTPGTFRIIYPHQYNQFVSQAPFFYQDDRRTFFVIPTDETVELLQIVVSSDIPFGGVFEGLDIGIGGEGIDVVTAKLFRFHSFYYPFACDLIKQLNKLGIKGILATSNDATNLQLKIVNFFKPEYDPIFDTGLFISLVKRPFPKDELDFSFEGSYSLYNWELFFHIPLLIADRLRKNQRFAEALQWFHYIFNPMDRSADPAPARYWQIRPFFEHEQVAPLDQLMKLLSVDLSDAPDDVKTAIKDLCDQITEWRSNPFNPHLIARMRTTPYMKAVVMKYCETCIAWGDQLFRRDTIEFINEATQWYILAAEILGPRPESIPPRQQTEQTEQTETYNTLQTRLDELSNALIGVEERTGTAHACPRGTIDPGNDAQPWLGLSLYFCIPKNDYLLKYWDTVEDRLFKIRHCMNIEGVVRQLPLFQPPIEPGLLVRAAALGMDLSSALNDIFAGLPHYRFSYMQQKALEFCNDVRNLGGALLSALEKRDAEALARLRAGQETALLEKIKAIKESQIDEAEETLEGLHLSREVTAIRHDYYKNIAFMNASERTHLSLLEQTLDMQTAQGMVEYLANTLSLIPDLKVGSPTTAGATTGGSTLGGAMRAMAGYLGTMISLMNTSASMSATLGGYQRRFDDWKLQERLAEKELEQLDKQIAAAEIRKAIAEKDLQNHETQIENARKVETFMQEKFTNRELYDWMIGQISPIFFQSYQMAYDLAKRAEKAFQHESGQYDKTFIKFGYWDNLKKGLLAGDRLYHDLKRMEKAYMDQHKREYELTKSISLALLDPIALINLKETGECFVNLPEEIFDLDYPGHYFRRLKNVRLTIPCVAGPHTTVNCTLTLLSNSIRIDPSVGTNGYKRNETGDDTRFRDNVGAIQSIATSTAQNDGGLFELNFRDERYLPFEGAGAISSWRIELTTDKDLRQFDYDTITDVILHLSYTAREGGARFKQESVKSLRKTIEEGLLKLANEDGLLQMFSLKHEFPNQWHRFLHPAGDGAPHVIELDISQERFPFMFQEKEITISEAIFYLKPKSTERFSELPFSLSIDGGSPLKDNSNNDPSFQISTNSIPEERFSNGLSKGAWSIEIASGQLAGISVEDIWLVVKYKVPFLTST